MHYRPCLYAIHPQHDIAYKAFSSKRLFDIIYCTFSVFFHFIYSMSTTNSSIYPDLCKVILLKERRAISTREIWMVVLDQVFQFIFFTGKGMEVFLCCVDKNQIKSKGTSSLPSALHCLLSLFPKVHAQLLYVQFFQTKRLLPTLIDKEVCHVEGHFDCRWCVWVVCPTPFKCIFLWVPLSSIHRIIVCYIKEMQSV